MAQCLHCQQIVSQSAKYCPSCGLPLLNADPSVMSNISATTKINIGPRLQVHIPGQPEQEIPLSPDLTVSIGRDPSNIIQVPLSMVSHSHAKVFHQNEGYVVMDMNSTNGTYLQGKRIPPLSPQVLPEGGVIRLCDTHGNSVSLVYLHNDLHLADGCTVSIGKTLLNNLPKLTIGRDPRSNIPIESPVVSWKHAELVRLEKGYIIRDLGSTNGTYVNGRKILQSILKKGDVVQIGPYKLTYNLESIGKATSLGNVRLDGLQLVVEVDENKTPKRILNDVSISIMPREFVALVGTSGAGKSTLMDALNGFRKASMGHVLINGDDLYDKYDAYRSSMGYVPQSDILHRELTVGKALKYTAKLRLPPDVTYSVIDRQVDLALQKVEMQPQINQPIASLSGGQRKRVSIASEMISEPSLFFLDEPTSGLDPGLDKKMMFTLNTLADSGRTIILTTHATRNINNQCDLVGFMSYGRLVYYGPPARAITFFGVTDFADIYSKLDNPKSAELWEGQYKSSSEYAKFIVDRQSSLPVLTEHSDKKIQNTLWTINWKIALHQFLILIHRNLDLILCSKFRIFVLLAVMPIIGFLVLMIAKSNSLIGDTANVIEDILHKDGFYSIVGEAQKLLYILALAVILLGVFAAAYEIIREDQIYKRERMANLGILPYLGSKIVVLFGFGLLQVLAILAVISLKVHYPKDGILLPAILEIYITLELALMVGVALGLFISSVVRHDNVVIYLILVVLFLQVIFSGVLFDLPGIAKPIALLIPTRWTIEGLGSTVNMEELNNLSKTYIEQAEVQGRLTQIDSTIASKITFSINYSRTPEHLITTWIVLMLFFIFFTFMSAILVKRKEL